MDYKKLLKSVKPKINFTFSDIILVYDVEYKNVSASKHRIAGYRIDDEHLFHDCVVNFKRISGDKKYTVANKVLLTVLHTEISEIRKYMGDRYFSFRVDEELDICK